MRNLIQKSLNECSKRQLSSVAFPALGAGNLCFPNKVVAKLMVEEINKHFASNRKSSIKAVHLVIFMAETYQAFQQELATGRSYLSTQSAVSTPATAAATSGASRGDYSGRKVSEAPQAGRGHHAYQIEQLNVTVTVGDITRETSDAVVNSTNEQMQLSGPGVSGALLRKGGKKLQRLCDDLVSQGCNPTDEVQHTVATGQLQCKFVIHAVFDTQNYDKFTRTIVACLKKAEELRCSSIAFPAVGTGVHGYTPQAVASQMVQAIKEFASPHPRHLTSVRLVLFQAEHFQDFANAFKNPSGILERAGKWVHSKVAHLLPWSSASGSSTTTEEHGELENIPFTSEDMYRELKINIYGESTKSVGKAKKEIQKLIDQQFITEHVDDQHVGKLPSSEVTKLKRRGQELQVQVDVDGYPLNRILLKGSKDEVSKLMLEVHHLLADTEKEIMRKEAKQAAAEQLCKVVQWKRIDDQGTVDYDPEENYEIEQAHEKKEPSYTRQTSSEHYTIDFLKGIERDKQSGCIATVKRVDLEQQYRQGKCMKLQLDWWYIYGLKCYGVRFVNHDFRFTEPSIHLT